MFIPPKYLALENVLIIPNSYFVGIMFDLN